MHSLRSEWHNLISKEHFCRKYTTHQHKVSSHWEYCSALYYIISILSIYGYGYVPPNLDYNTKLKIAVCILSKKTMNYTSHRTQMFSFLSSKTWIFIAHTSSRQFLTFFRIIHQYQPYRHAAYYVCVVCMQSIV